MPPGWCRASCEQSSLGLARRSCINSQAGLGQAGLSHPSFSVTCEEKGAAFERRARCSHQGKQEAPGEACTASSFLLAGLSGALFTDAVVEPLLLVYAGEETSLRCVPCYGQPDADAVGIAVLSITPPIVDLTYCIVINFL